MRRKAVLAHGWLWSLTWMKLRVSCQAKPARCRRTSTADVPSGGASHVVEFTETKRDVSYGQLEAEGS